MLLAAGLGTRLRPLTLERPKPLVMLGDRPLLGHAVATARAAGLERLVVNAFHLPEQILAWGQREGVEVSVESELLGTAGGVAQARARLTPPCVVWNGDLHVPGAPLRALLEAGHDAGICLLVAPRPRGQGTVGLSAEGLVVRLRAERFGVEASGGDYVGLVGLDGAALDELPARGCLVGDFFLPRLRAGRPVKALPWAGAWADLGVPAAYLEQNLAWLRERAASCYVAPGVELPRAVTATRVLLGEGVQVHGAGELRDVVAWPGARVVAPLRRAIVTPTQLLAVPEELRG